MKVLLQGYLHNANFGDMLAALLFYNKCVEVGFQETDFIQYKDYGIGSFCRKEIGYTKEKSLLSCLFADVFVLIAGGSLWNDGSIPNDAKIRFRRFILPALIYQLMHKPVYVLGVGGGAVDTIWLRKKMVRFLNKAKLIYFRDSETKYVFEEYGVNNKMLVTADTVLALKRDILEEFEDKEALEEAANGRKKMLLHIPDGIYANKCLINIILPGIILFLKNHTEYFLVMSHDNIQKRSNEEKQYVESLYASLDAEKIDYYYYKYNDAKQMCSFINEMDCIVTLKLHVGVVGAVFDKAVVPFPVHQKTDNFYRMINESERCINVRLLDQDLMLRQMELYHDVPIHVSDELKMRAEMNLSALGDIIADRQKNAE